MFPSNNDLSFSPLSYNYNTNSMMKPFSINDIFLENVPFDDRFNFPFFRFPETSFTQTQITNQEQVLSTLPTMENNAVLQRNKIRGVGKKDRHSKIKTKNGLRDRRMRLSLEIARKFFWLQDVLGFDKASKTVEWLLQQAKPEIMKLSVSTTNHEISTVETSKPKTAFSSSTVEEKVNRSTNAKNPKEKKSVEKCRFRTVSKEVRVKARERARERTKEKRRNEFVDSKVTAVANNDLSYLCSSSNNRGSFETGEESRTQNVNNQQGEIMEESFEIVNNWSSLTILNNAAASLEHQYAELQSFLGRPNWEVYNTNQNFF